MHEPVNAAPRTEDAARLNVLAKQLRRMDAWPIAVAGIAILPWGIAIHRREADFWRYFFWQEHVHRFLSHHAQHAKPAWFFIPILLLGALPWTPVLPAVLLGLNRKAHHRRFVRLVA